MKILIVIPAYNEEKILADTTSKLYNFCGNNLKDDWQLVIVNNKSTDKTTTIAKSLAGKYNQISYLYLDKKGKGRAIRAGWLKDLADIYCFMDADLATDLSALPSLIQEIKNGYDLVIGSRFCPQSKVKRSLSRRLISKFYRLVLKIIFKTKIKDVPCGFKAISSKVKKELLPQVKNEEWFFDSELVILAEKQGYKIKEIPVTWTEPRQKDNKSRVKILPIICSYFKEFINLKRRLK